jgi:Zn-dependent peptidase ImmA (M78 family)/DNA-binding XRE family transcriptional regulator
MELVEKTPQPDERLQDVARAFDPARLVQARRLSRLTKADLYKKLDKAVSAAAIGQYERGEIKPRVETLVRLSKALNVPVGFFSHGRPRVQLEIAQASFRRLRSTTILQQQQAISYAEQAWEMSSLLEESVEFPEIDLPDWAWGDESELADHLDPIAAARAIRAHWKLGASPVKFLVAELEQHGILTVLFSMKEDAEDEKSRIDAFSTSALPRPLIVLTPDKADDVMRHRFSAAHELGHIVLHRDRPSNDSLMEREADAFASEFLTPRDELLTELPRRFSLQRLQYLSQRWGVSVKSLIFRSKELELISEATARRAYITLANLTKDKMIRTESIALYPGENPELLRNAVELLESVGTPITEIAQSLQWPVQQVRRIAGIEDVRPRLSLVK